MSAASAIDSSVTLDEVFTVLAAKRVPLAPELAGYLVLGIAEHADPAGGDVDPRSVFLGEEGTVALVKPRRETASGDAEASVRAMLARLLEASGSLTPALAAASRRKSGAGLRALANELETALIPVNRAAGRRALARLAREVRRVTLGVGRNALPSASELGAARRSLSSSVASVGGETPSPPIVTSTSTSSSGQAAARSLSPAVVPVEPPRRPVSLPGDVDAVVEQFSVPTTQPLQVRTTGASPSRARRAPSRNGMTVAILALVVSAGAVAAMTLRLSAPAPRSAATVAPRGAATPTSPQAEICKGTLVISNVPAHAEVLMRQGQAPVDVGRMPVGARLEFVATAEGYAPKRVVVPQGAAWDRTPEGKARFEVAVQLDRSKNGADPWPAGEPGSEVGGQGAPGTVHVVATPHGAEIWMLAGIGPDARVDQLPCDRDWDLLVAGPTTFRKRLHVSAADFHSEEAAGGHVARVSAK
ncbi:MAG: hypothetical protein FWD17_13390 [Polyangiaceae bacterium]|nr:hypothetical protein [Polyangiaceae bacterium]